MSDTEMEPAMPTGTADDEAQKVMADMKVADSARRHARNAQPKLNEARLTSEQGLPALAEKMRAWKPKSGRDEFGDLDDVMNVIENWAHRLYPKYKFDDFLAQTYKLGSKRAVKACMYRLRAGETNDEVENQETTVEPSATLVTDNTETDVPIEPVHEAPIDYDQLEEDDFIDDDMPDEDDLAEFEAQLHGGVPPPPKTAPAVNAPIFEQAKRRRVVSDSSDDDAFEAYLSAQTGASKEKKVVEKEKSPSPSEASDGGNAHVDGETIEGERENEKKTLSPSKSNDEVDSDDALQMLID